MSQIFDCVDTSKLLPAARAARQAIGAGELVVMPTDTVYGVAADAFSPEAVQRLLDAKGRGRQSPPPVLIPNTDTLAALAAEVVEPVRMLAEAFWPGQLTIVLRAQSALDWDLGETGGTVALRIPDHELALELLQETGPLAVSSANKSGEPAARSIADAERMLGEAVSVYLDAGDVLGDGTASTIIDATRLTDEGGALRILREGTVSREALEALFADSDSVSAPEGVSAEAESAEPEAAKPEAAEPEPAKLEAANESKAAEGSQGAAASVKRPKVTIEA